MTSAARAELADAIRPRYAAATTREKRQILEGFIAATGYHKKSAIRVLNRLPTPRGRTRRRLPLYDDAVRSALIVLWEASDRVCSKRLKALLPILIPALERNGHLALDELIRPKILSMSAATVDRLLREPRTAGQQRRRKRTEPEPRRRIKMRTFADWNDPSPGNMEMDLVAHCGSINRGSYVHSLVLTDIASGWTEAAPIVVREGTLVVETLERIRCGLPFALRALDVDNGTEFVNEKLIEYCLGHGIELTRSRPYRKNDQAWIEQKNGAVVRRLLGYRRFEGLAAARSITRLYAASRLFVNFFQPSFKLAAKQREGAKVTKRYHPPQTPCERLLQSDGISMAVKTELREVLATLDPLKLLEEIRAIQAYLVALADGEVPPPMIGQPPNLAAFVAHLSSAWHMGEVRPTFSIDAKPQYLRGLQRVPTRVGINVPAMESSPAKPSPCITRAPEQPPQKLQPVYAKPGQANVQALRMVWPIVCRRLESLPNINASQLFDELCVQFPGRFTRRQYKSLLRRVNLWREDALARGVVIGSKTYRLSGKPRGRRPDFFRDHWAEMISCLEDRPDQTALELLVEFQARYPDQYSLRQLSALQRRVRAWRQEAIQRLAIELTSNILGDAARNSTTATVIGGQP
jgi:hypothetical protein